MGTRTSWRTVIGSIQPAKQLRHLIRRLSLGALMLSLVGCATVQEKYPNAAAVNSGSGPACGSVAYFGGHAPSDNPPLAPASNGNPPPAPIGKLFLMSCWFTDYGWFLPNYNGVGGTYEETPLGWEIADGLSTAVIVTAGLAVVAAVAGGAIFVAAEADCATHPGEYPGGC